MQRKQSHVSKEPDSFNLPIDKELMTRFCGICTMIMNNETIYIRLQYMRLKYHNIVQTMRNVEKCSNFQKSIPKKVGLKHHRS